MSASTPSADRMCVVFPQTSQGRVEGPALKERLKALRASGCQRVVLNLDGVEEMDLVAIGSLLEETRSYKSRDGRLVVAEMAGHLRDLCARVGALSSLELFGSQREALDALAGG